MASIEHLQIINSPVYKVYAALTTREGLSEVWTNDLIVDATVGAINEFHFGANDTAKMKVVELLPNHTIKWECVYADADTEWIGTTITFKLNEADGKTTIDFSHANWKEVTACYRFCNYNWAMFLLSLKQYCESGKGTPYQKRNF